MGIGVLQSEHLGEAFASQARAQAASLTVDDYQVTHCEHEVRLSGVVVDASGASNAVDVVASGQGSDVSLRAFCDCGNDHCAHAYRLCIHEGAEPDLGGIAAWCAEITAQVAERRGAQVAVNELLYVVSVEQRRVFLQCCNVYRRRDGEISDRQTRAICFDAINDDACATDLDRLIAAAIPSHRAATSRIELTDECDLPWPALLKTGRVRLTAPNGPLMRLGEPLVASVRWEERAAHLRLVVDVPSRLVVLPGREARYLNQEMATIGRLESGIDVSPQILAAAPPIPLRAVERMDDLWRDLHQVGLPVPASVAARLPEAADVAFELRITGFLDQVQIDLSAIYPGSVRVGPLWPRAITTPDGRLIRHLDVERAACHRLAGFLPQPPSNTNATHSSWRIDRTAAAALLLDGLPELRAAGWMVETGPEVSLRERPVADHQLGFAITTHASDRDALSVTLQLRGEAQLPIVPLLEKVAPYRDDLTALPERIRVVIPESLEYIEFSRARVLQLVSVLEELGNKARDGEIRCAQTVPRVRLPELIARDPDLVNDANIDKSTLIAAKRLVEGDFPVVSEPQGFAGELLPFQRRALGQYLFLRQHGANMLLALEMGLGKTVIAAAIVQEAYNQGRLHATPALIVSTKSSLESTWEPELARFVPQLRVLVIGDRLTRAQRHEVLAQAAEYDVLVVGYGTFRRDFRRFFAQQRFPLVIADEASEAMRNPRSQVATAMRELQHDSFVPMSGTPIENSTDDLWAQMAPANPGLLGPLKHFQQHFTRPIKTGDAVVADALRQRIKPYLFRATHEDPVVASELPPLTELRCDVAPTPSQAELYEIVRQSQLEGVREKIAQVGIKKAQAHILSALTRLRQVCIDPRLVPVGAARDGAYGPGAKMAAVRELAVRHVIDGGSQMLIFCSYVRALELIEQELDALGIASATLRGDCSERARADAEARFKQGDIPVLLISLMSGSKSLTLIEASHAIQVSPWWNWASEFQAAYRMKRIGQTKPMFVHRLMTPGSVEERILQVAAQKQSVAHAVLDGGELDAYEIDEQAVNDLFAPLGSVGSGGRDTS